MIKIPKYVQTVPNEASARLLEKQWKAKVWMRSNPFARAMNLKLKRHFQQKEKSYEK